MWTWIETIFYKISPMRSGQPPCCQNLLSHFLINIFCCLIEPILGPLYLFYIKPTCMMLTLILCKAWKNDNFFGLLHARFGNELSVACWLIFDPRSWVVEQIWTSVNRNSMLCGLWLNSFQHIWRVLNKSVLSCRVSDWNQEKWDNEKQEQNVPKTYAWGKFFSLSLMAYWQKWHIKCISSYDLLPLVIPVGSNNMFFTQWKNDST